MPTQPKRYAEIRLLVLVAIDLTNDELAAALKVRENRPSSVAELVRQEVIANLESVSYVETAIVTHL